MSTAASLLDQLNDGCDLELTESLARDLIDEHRQALDVMQRAYAYLTDSNIQAWLNRSGYKSDEFGRLVLLLKTHIDANKPEEPKV